MPSDPTPETPAASALTAASAAPSLETSAGDPTLDADNTGFLTGGPQLRRYLLWFGVATAAITTVWGGVTGIILPNHVQLLQFAQFFTGADSSVDLQALNDLKAAIGAGTATATADQERQLDILREFDASKASSLALVGAVGSILTMIAQPIIGVLSDRTRSGMGRRAPWILFGGIIGAFFLVSVRFAPSIAVLVVLWSFASLILNSASAPLAATVADRVATAKRGTASAIGGLGNFAGGILGAVIAGIAFNSIGLNAYFIPAAFVVFGVVLFVLLAKDRSSRELIVDRFSVPVILKGFLVPLRSSDFRWVWIARVVLTFGYAVSTAMVLYILQSYVQPALSASEATSLAPLLAVIGFPGTLIGLVVAGRLSDKLGRRKPFVIFASLLMGLSFLIPLISPTVPALMITGVLSGLAFGAYLSVDQALFIDVLPDKKSAGRDLGVAALGNNLGQSLGPIAAAQIVVLTGGYGGIYLLAAIVVIAGAAAVIPVKAVR